MSLSLTISHLKGITWPLKFLLFSFPCPKNRWRVSYEIWLSFIIHPMSFLLTVVTCHTSTRSSGGWNFSTPVSDLYLSQFPPLPTPQNYHYSISMPGFFYPSRQTVPLQYFNTFKSRRWWFWNHLYVCDEKKHFSLLRVGLGYGSGQHKSTWSNLTHLDQSPAFLTFWWYH